MVFIIRWGRRAERFLSKLPENIARRIVHRVDDLKHEPFRFLESYAGADFYKLRVGGYRLSVDVDLKEKSVSIRIIGHRRNIYQQ